MNNTETDISKEAVERLAKTADLFAKAMKAFQHKTQKHNEDVRDTLRAQAARIEQLEARQYELAYAIAGGEDVPGLLDSVETSELVGMILKERASARDAEEYAARTARNDALKEAADACCDPTTRNDVYAKSRRDAATSILALITKEAT